MKAFSVLNVVQVFLLCLLKAEDALAVRARQSQDVLVLLVLVGADYARIHGR